MSFSVKQLLSCMAVVAIGLMALANAGKPFVKELIDLLTLGILIFMAYSAWTSDGLRRAFKIGFVTWGILYYWFFKRAFDIGTSSVLYYLSPAFRKVMSPASTTPPNNPFGPAQQWVPGADWDESYYSIGNSVFLLLFALVGGWVTMYFYRKRQQVLAKGH